MHFMPDGPKFWTWQRHDLAKICVSTLATNFPSSGLFENSGILSIFNLYNYEVYKFLCKSENNLHGDPTLNYIFREHLKQHNVHGTRAVSRNAQVAPFASTNVLQFSIVVRGCRLLNFLRTHDPLFSRLIIPDETHFNKFVHSFADNFLLKNNSLAEHMFPASD